MKYRRLGKTGMKVSVIGIGTWQLGGEWGKEFEQAEVDSMIDKGAELGINLIDTAECYGDHLSEKLVGQAVKGRREKWIIATKFGHKFMPNFDRENLFDTPGLWEMLQKQVESGKIRHLGISISSKLASFYQVEKATDAGAETIQAVYNRVNRKPEEKIFDSCIRQNLGVLARVPLASGFLSGKYSKDSKFPGTDVRSSWQDQDEWRETFQEVERFKQEVPKGVPMAQWALAWCLKHPAVTCVIPGCKSVEQVESNALAAELQAVKDEHPQAAL
jgi:myo-inositol catabolism protein IolS